LKRLSPDELDSDPILSDADMRLTMESSFLGRPSLSLHTPKMLGQVALLAF
jgi:hypothetical protein